MAADIRMAIAALFYGPVVTLPQFSACWRRSSTSLSGLSSRNRWYLVKLTLWRTQLFNHYAGRCGERGLSVWKNRKFYLRIARALSGR